MHYHLLQGLKQGWLVAVPSSSLELVAKSASSPVLYFSVLPVQYCLGMRQPSIRLRRSTPNWAILSSIGLFITCSYRRSSVLLLWSWRDYKRLLLPYAFFRMCLRDRFSFPRYFDSFLIRHLLRVLPSPLPKNSDKHYSSEEDIREDSIRCRDVDGKINYNTDTSGIRTLIHRLRAHTGARTHTFTDRGLKLPALSGCGARVL